MKIAFDVMGSDNGIKNPILAAKKLIAEFLDVELILVGNEKEINRHLKTIYEDKKIPARISVQHAENEIKMDSNIIDILRTKNSSMQTAIMLVKNKIADGVLTSGSTAAYLMLSQQILGKIAGVTRAAFMAIMPTMVKNKSVLLLDVGANVENSTTDLLNFATMANTYSKIILKTKQPKISLANIGTEANKGTKVLQETYKILEELAENSNNANYLNFQGNIEARNVLKGKVDIVVCDGYTGNIILKSLEGMATLILNLLKKELTKNCFRKFIAFFCLPIIKEIKTTFDYKNTGGAQLIGIDGICFKAHGASDDRAYYSTLKLLRKAILQDVTNKIKEQIATCQKK